MAVSDAIENLHGERPCVVLILADVGCNLQLPV